MNSLITRIDATLTGRPRPSGALVAAGIAISALVIPFIPDAAEALQWHRDAPWLRRSFEWITGHLTHWSWDHLIWDLAAFLSLSFAALRLIPGRYVLCVLMSALAIPLEIDWNQAGLTSYRGLSGIDSALFGLVVAGLWRNGAPHGVSALCRLLAAAGGIAFAGKAVFELGTGHALFVSDSGAGFIPAVSAHLTGMICGLVAGLFRRNERLRGDDRKTSVDLAETFQGIESGMQLIRQDEPFEILGRSGGQRREPVADHGGNHIGRRRGQPEARSAGNFEDPIFGSAVRDVVFAPASVNVSQFSRIYPQV